ncbi:hypothetical protein [Flavobacterium suzhouense]|uniref:Uncharacterized protein n=1 Tax=Flavobacterium suzhouense TaxID=1529638 RepID=A0ABW5NS61_9FLAO
MESKFSKLIDELYTGIVVFIDDDFVPVTNSGEILCHLLGINDIDYSHISEPIEKLVPEFMAELNAFKQAFVQIILSGEDTTWLESGEIVELLKNKQLDDLAQTANSICTAISDNIEEFSKIAMNFGLVATDGAACYKSFFKSLNSHSPKKSVRVFKGLEGDVFNQFEEEVAQVISKTNEKHCLLIVDKKLGNQQDGNQIILDIKTSDKIKSFFSVLFTSQPEDPPKQELNSELHFHFEIPKEGDGDYSALEKVSEGLALCAYISLFVKLFDLKHNALKHAKDIVLSSGKGNMLFLSDMAHAEGITVFQTINNWFDLLVQKIIQDRLLDKDETLDFDFIMGLTTILNPEFLKDSENNISEIFRNELNELNRFELFNYSLNLTYAPPSPGDLYLIDGKIYILTGQDCDLIVRDNSKVISRKEKLAEMIECEFVHNLLDERKSEDEKTLSMNYFLFGEDFGHLKIHLNRRAFYDFRILDLCSLNEDGQSILSKNEELKKSAIKALPKMWQEYYPKLKCEIIEKIKVYNFIKESGINSNVLSADTSFLLEPFEDENKIIFPVSRLASVKGQIKDYLLQKYWEYKTRKGLNTISLFNRREITVDAFKCGFDEVVEFASKPKASLKLSNDRETNKKISKLPLILEREDLMSLLDSPYKEIFKLVSKDEIVLATNDFIRNEESMITFKKSYTDKKLAIEIRFPYYNSITQRFFIVKGKLSLLDIFGEDFMNENPLSQDSSYLIEGKEEAIAMSNKKHESFTPEILEKGVIITSPDLHIKLDRKLGVINLVEKVNVDNE